MKKSLMLFGLAVFLLMSPVKSAFASMPAIIDIVVDSTSSVSDEDFNKEKAAVMNLVETLYKRSQLNEGQLADWVTVSYFGGNDDYTGYRFINCSNEEDVLSVEANLLMKDHPNFSSTAIYTAICMSSVEVLQKEQELDEPEGTYARTIILITDGDDNGSDANYKALVQKLYPNDEMLLMIIGVGNNCDLSEFNQYSNVVKHIDDFDDLALALTLALQLQ